MDKDTKTIKKHLLRSSVIADRHKIILISESIDESEAKEIASNSYMEDVDGFVFDVVKGESVLAGYYCEYGYSVYNAFTLPPSEYKDVDYQLLMNRTSFIVAYLNPDKDVDVLLEYLDAIASENFDREKNVISRKYMKWCIEKVFSDSIEVHPIDKTIYWIGKYRYAEVGVKRRLSRSFLNRNVYVKNMANVVDLIKTVSDNELPVFITAKYIKEKLGISYPTALKYYKVVKEDINKYNMKMFHTDFFKEYIKLVSVGKIVKVIDNYIVWSMTKLTQLKVAEDTKLHKNTVNKLWTQEDVANIIDKYNEWLFSTKKAM